METVTRRGWKPVVILAVVVGLYWVAMFAGTHLPFQTTPKGDPYSLDKLEHITAFAVFAILLCTAGSFTPLSRTVLYSGVLVFIAAYAAIDEVSQRFVIERTPDVFDWLADVVGAALGVLGFAIFRTRRRNRAVSSSGSHGDAPDGTAA
jgi:VanZ family protein